MRAVAKRKEDENSPKGEIYGCDTQFLNICRPYVLSLPAQAAVSLAAYDILAVLAFSLQCLFSSNAVLSPPSLVKPMYRKRPHP